VFARPVEPPRGEPPQVEPVVVEPVVVAAPVVAAPIDDEEDDEEEWEWRLAMARAKAAIEAAEAAALTAPVKRVPTIEVVIATPVAPVVEEELVDESEAVTVITPAATMSENLAACRAEDAEEDAPTVVAFAPAQMAERMRREVQAAIASEPTTRPAIEVIEAAIAAAAPAASVPPRRPRTQPIGIISQRPAERRDNGFTAATSTLDAAWATPAVGAVARTARATPPPIPERARRTTPPPIRLDSDAEPLTDEEIAEALALSEDTVVTAAATPIAIEVEARPHRRAAMGTPAPLPRLSSPRTPLPRLSAFLRTRGRR